MKEGHHAEAEALARELHSRSRKGTIEEAESIDLLVQALISGGKAATPETRDLADRAVELKRSHLDSADPRLADSLTNLGKVLLELDEYQEARLVLERSLEIQTRVLPADHPALAETLTLLANDLIALGEYSEARSSYERALEIRTAIHGADSPELAGYLYNLANVLRPMGDYAAAEPLFERALRLTIAGYGPEDYRVAWVCNGYGLMRADMGDYTRARSEYDRAIAIAKSALPSDHFFQGVLQNNLGLLLRDLGDLDQARAAFQEALRINRASFGGDHPATAKTIMNLGELLQLAGQLEEARSLQEEALSIRRAHFPAHHPEVVMSMTSLAALLTQMEEYPAARRLYDEILGVWDQSLTVDHRDYAWFLSGFARLATRTGDYVSALPRYEQALRIVEASLGADHPALASTLRDMGLVYAVTGRQAEALDFSLRAESVARAHVRLTASALPERQALRYSSVRASGLDQAISLAVDRLDTSSTRDVWDSLIRSRALVLDEVTSRNRALDSSGDPETARLMSDFAAASQRLANLSIRGLDPDHPGVHQELLLEARGTKERTERALGAKSSAFARRSLNADLGFKEVQDALPPGSTLIAYVLYEAIAGREAIPSYAAFVLRDGGDPRIVKLGPAQKIDQVIKEWTIEIARGRLGKDESSREVEAAYRRIGVDLRRSIWDPLGREMAGADRVFIVPDGSVHLVSFYALPSDGSTYLIESGPSVHYLTAERDLPALENKQNPGEGLLVLGGAAYDEPALFASLSPELDMTPSPGSQGGGPAAFRGSRSSCGAFADARFEALPASEHEANRVSSIWAETAGRRTTGQRDSSVVHLTGTQANETAFKRAAPGRRVLHLATHGFFLGGRCPALGGSGRGVGGLSSPAGIPEPPAGESSLLLSGLAFAGANLRAHAGDDEDDGILTAEEISAMDLSGVEWAVLSACDTAAGEPEIGEGVLGLRRAFQVAGAGSVIMSLWAVEDWPAADWMSSLYERRLLDGLTTIESMKEASLHALRQRRRSGASTHPFHWGGWIATGDWQ